MTLQWALSPKPGALTRKLNPLIRKLDPLTPKLAPLSPKLDAPLPSIDALPAALRNLVQALGRRGPPAAVEDVLVALCRWQPQSADELEFAGGAERGGGVLGDFAHAALDQVEDVHREGAHGATQFGGIGHDVDRLAGVDHAWPNENGGDDPPAPTFADLGAFADWMLEQRS